MAGGLIIRPMDVEAEKHLGKILHEIPQQYYQCNDGTFSTHNRKGACNFHNGLKEGKPLSPVKTGDTTDLVKLVPLTQIHTNKELFQNRKADYSQQTVDRIIESVKAGDFKLEVFDPIILWFNAKDSKLYILSGHSRTEAFRQLSAMGFKNFTKIPAKIVRVSLEVARKIAMESNTLATREKETERALYYRGLRQNGLSAQETDAKAKRLEGDNASRIIAYSYLNPSGNAFTSLQALENGDEASANVVKTLATWTGEAMRRNPYFTSSHENEVYNWLKNTAYGTKAGQISNKLDFFQRLQIAIARNTEFGNFDSSKPLNLYNSTAKSDIEINYDVQLETAKRTLSEAKTERDKKLKEFTQRGAEGDKLDKAMKPYNDATIIAQKRVLELMEQKGAMLEARKNQTALFGGLGRVPEMKLIFRTNDEMLEFGQLYKNYVDKPGNEKFNDFLNRFLKANKIRPIDPNLNGLGSNFMRTPTYQTLNDYSHLFRPKTDGNTRFLIKRTANLDDTLRAIKQVVHDYKSEVAPLAEHLKDPSGNDVQTFYNVWHWTFNNITYKLDEVGKEQLRTPYRSWVDRKTGSDCDCMTILTSCILINQGYDPKPLVVGQNYSANFSHIFTTVQGYAIDPVPPLKEFNQIAPNISKIMMLEVLAGVDGNTEPVICGLGAVAPATNVTKDLMDRQSHLIKRLQAGDKSRATRNEFSKIRYGIMLNGTEEQAVYLDIADGVSHINSRGDVVLYDDVDEDEINSYVDEMLTGGLDGLGKAKRRQSVREKLKNVTKSVKKTVQNVKQTAQKTVKNVAKNVQNTAKKAGEVIKKVNRLNPVTVAARYAFLALLRINFLKMATSLKWSYLSEAEAQKKGVNMDEWRKLVNTRKQVEKVFSAFGGKDFELKNTIIKGGKGLSGEQDLNRFDVLNSIMGLGVAAETSAATAAPILVKVKTLLSKINFKKLFEGIKKIAENKQVQDFTKKIVGDKIKDKLNRKKENINPVSPENDGFKNEQERAAVMDYEENNTVTEPYNPDSNLPAAETYNPSDGSQVVTEPYNPSNEVTADYTSDATANQTEQSANETQNQNNATANQSNSTGEEKSGKGWVLPLLLVGVGIMALK